jgi:transcriptional regulator with XRE-family HTH domain
VDFVAVGASLRALRIRRRLRQQDLADRAGVGRGDVRAIEIGRADRVSLDVLHRVAEAFGARIEVRVRWNGEQLDRLLDEAHARTVAATVIRLGRNGWETAVEASFPI